MRAVRAIGVTVELVTDNYFSMIGVQPSLGRLILPNEGRGASIVIGAAFAAGLARLLRNALFDVSPFDPFTYLLVAAVLLAVCLVAAFVPARRATMVDPLVALRAE